MKKLLALLVCVMSSILLLSGCTADRPQTLRVLVEESADQDSLGFHSQVNRWIDEFETEHEGVTIILEVLPLDVQSRAPMIQQIRSELMAGKGPDIILMPNAYSDQAITSGQTVLITDVSLAMENGMFLDISKYYDADTALDTDKLQQTVMDAGVLGDARFVLPLRYDIPVIYVDKQAFWETGLSCDLLDSDIITLMNGVTAIEDDRTAANFRLHWMQPQFTMNFLPDVFDYGSGKTMISQPELETFFHTYQNYWVRLLHAFDSSELSYRPVFYQYLGRGEYWTDTGNFLFIGSLQQMVENTAIANMKGVELEMHPIRAMDGSLVADVTYYGAVTAGCRNPELAYDFLREFLTEDFQWEQNLTQIGGTWRLASYGWPVRTEGSYAAIAEAVWARSEWQFTNNKYKITKDALMCSDCTILSAEIHEARFSISLERAFYKALGTLYDREGRKPSDVNISELAQTWIEKLQLHLNEG